MLGIGCQVSGCRESVIVDCSHGNSSNDYKKQSLVFHDLLHQMNKNEKLIGLMLESYFNGGSQDIDEGKDLKEGVSVTDSCISWGETEKLVNEAYDFL